MQVRVRVFAKTEYGRFQRREIVELSLFNQAMKNIRARAVPDRGL